MEADPVTLRRHVDEATARLAGTAAGLTDDDARQPSALAGWTRGHLLTHIARNADGLRNLLVWARTGMELPQYPSAEARTAGIEAGAGRGAGELLADLRESAAAFSAEAATLTGPAWRAPVHGMRGPDHPAWYTLVRRLVEVEIHHVDLDAGFGPADWPDSFVAIELPLAAADFAHRADVPACRLQIGGRTVEIGTLGTPAALTTPGTADAANAESTAETAGTADAADTAGTVTVPQPRTVAGPAHLLLAWLTGRSAGDGLTAAPGGPVPHLPAWSPDSGRGRRPDWDSARGRRPD